MFNISCTINLRIIKLIIMVNYINYKVNYINDLNVQEILNVRKKTLKANNHAVYVCLKKQVLDRKCMYI